MMVKKASKSSLQITESLIVFAFLVIFLATQLSLPLFAYQESGTASDRPLLSTEEEVVTETVHANAFPDKEAVITFDRVRLEIPTGAVERPVEITIEKLARINELNPGISNATGGAIGYRFKPDGIKFLKAIKVTIPFEKDSIKSQDDLGNLYTYFYNKEKELWEQLERVAVNEKEGQLTSITTHFTDMINGVLKLPDSPTPLSFNPTSIKDIKAADPGAGINLIEAPQANPQGTTNLQYPIEVPPGRNGMQPQLAIQYNSDGDNGWMGLGWDLSYQSVSIDTRWGVPRYDGSNESETYLLDGTQLTPTAHRGPVQPRSTEKDFKSRVEGSFKKIIRHGNSPKEYWWEVIEKNGVRYFYGGTPETGLKNESVLDGPDGIYKWALFQVRDTTGNTIDYTYSKVQDPGVANSYVQGIQLYLKEIFYTGTVGKVGLYSVTFLRDQQLGEARRPDIIIDGRAGFKVVTADRLGKIEVKYNNNLIRRYEFAYQTGPFEKTLLKEVMQYGQDGAEFNKHNFEYYDDLTQVTGNKVYYNGFSNTQVWNTYGTGLGRSLLLGRVDASVLGTTSSSTKGGHAYVGIGSGPQKDPSAGFKRGYSETTNTGMSSLIDLNGDGLPDKVFVLDGQVKYCPNLSKPNQPAQFGTPETVAGLSEISREKSVSNCYGFEGYYKASVMDNTTKTFTTAKVYFSDVNGDGLPDLIDNGMINFNRLEGGHPAFHSYVTGTPVLIGTGNVSGDLIDDFTQVYEEMVTNSPLMDPVRCWKAPYSGRITINAPVRLLNLHPPTDEPVDGVRVAIQRNNSEIWSQRILNEDFNTYLPAGVQSLNVNKGDHIYFRVQSFHHGAYDQVEWDPEISYLNVPADLLDANGLNPYRFKASEDITYTGRGGEVQVPLTGTIQVNLKVLKKEVTSDNIRILLYRNQDLVLEQTVNSDNAGGEVASIQQSVNVQQLDKIRVRLEADSQINAAAVICNSDIYYTASDSNVALYDPEGNPVIRLNALYELDLYSRNNLNSAPQYWEAPRNGTLVVNAHLAVDYESNYTDRISFTIKKSKQLLTKRQIVISGGSTNTPVVIDVAAGDRLYFDFTSRKTEVLSNVAVSVGVYYQNDFPTDPEEIPAPCALHSPEVPSPNILPQSYRGWSYFAYNGNGDRALTPIVESELNINNRYAEGVPKVFLMLPSPEKQIWESQDNLCWIGGSEISSSRLGTDNITVPKPGEVIGNRGVNRISYSTQHATSVGFYLSGSVADGTSYSELDLMDMNGDRFPDIVGKGQIQYSTPNGGLEATPRGINGFSKARTNKNDGNQLGVGGDPPLMIASALAHTTGSTTGKADGLMPSLGINLELLGDASSYTKEDLIDMNGDGLPDKVRKDGNNNIYVTLNLGYAFAAAEELWGNGFINYGRNLNQPFELSPGFGYNNGNFGIAFGASFSNSKSQDEKSLIDINGDGLPDLVTKEGAVMKVALNTGSGFTGEFDWLGALTDRHLNDTANISAGAGAYFTYPIPIVPPFIAFYVIINPGANVNNSVGRREAGLMDVNGDGYLDHVLSTNDGSMTVALNQVGKTNKLKKVFRPLGASFTLEYERDGNTYDLPQNKWVLSKVELNDGHSGDGVDTLLPLN